MPDDLNNEPNTAENGEAANPADELTAAPAKKTAARKSAAKKTAVKKTAAKKTTAEKTAVKKTTTRKSAASRAAASSEDVAAPETTVEADAAPTEAAADAPAAPVVKRTTRKRTTKKAVVAAPEAAEPAPAPAPAPELAPEPVEVTPEVAAPVEAAPVEDASTRPVVKRTTRKRTTKKAATAPAPLDVDAAAAVDAPAEAAVEAVAEPTSEPASETAVLFQAPKPVVTKKTSRKRKRDAGPVEPVEQPVEPLADGAEDEADETEEAAVEAAALEAVAAEAAQDTASTSDDDEGADSERDSAQDGEPGEGGSGRRRRRRGGRRRRKSSDSGESGDEGSDDARGDTARDASTGDDAAAPDGEAGEDGDIAETGETPSDTDQESGEGGGSRRRRRRRRSGDGDSGDGEGDAKTVTRSRRSSSRTGEDQITAISGSTRLEAKKQRRREGREAGRRRAPIVSEAEFLARRESVERVMVVRQREELTQIGVLEDKVLVEHYVARESQTSLIGNVYLGRVQNVLPSMEAAFVDIGRGRNAVLYAGEVNWSALGHKDGQARKIESVLSSGQSVLVQVTKDPIGHKGARLTSQVSLPGRFLVYVPDGTTSGISRKLPDTERNRLKTLLKEIVPDSAGVIVRTAAEGASEDELTRDVERLKARWDDIEKKSKGSAPQLLYGEPDLTLKVVRDLFTEDFSKLVIQGDDAWESVQSYVAHLAPDLEERLEKYDAAEHNGIDLFSTYRVDEQIAKGLDRKVWLPSGGSLIIDRTEAMTVVDVNTGKFTGSGGNLEETVTKNNLEAAEEIVRQLRLRDIGGIIVVDFIDMVLESNRDLVLRRLVECLGRDRTRHQVAEVTSLGLVQMTRKRIGTGLVEAFSETCDHCQGRGLVLHDHPVDAHRGGGGGDEGGGGDNRRSGGGRRSRGGRGRNGDGDAAQQNGGQQNGGQNGGQQNGGQGAPKPSGPPSPKDVAAMARPPAPETDEEATEVEPAVEAADVPSFEDRADAPTEAPTVVEEVAPVDEVEPEPEAEPTPEPTPDPTPEPSRPTVVTRTRRRSASRPAGPPVVAATGDVGTPAADGAVEPGTADGSDEPEATGDTAEHVPVKRRGSRKR